MAVAYFTIPETGEIIYNGDTVILSEFPETIAVVAYGWYRYEETAMNGWHFILLPSKTVIPVSQVDLSLLVVVPNSSDDCRCPAPIPPIPRDAELRAFITVDSIAQRDKLITDFLPNGKIICVNDIGDGTPGYYKWNTMIQDWVPWDIATTTEILDSKLSVIEPLIEEDHHQLGELSADVGIIESKVSNIEKDVETWKLNDLLENTITGYPNLSADELNEILETRLNGGV